MIEIAKEYLQKVSVTETQFAITKHVDKDHMHLHVIANLVNNKGETIKDNWIGLRGKKVAQQLTRKYQLKEATGKNLALTHLENLNEKEGRKYVICQAISGAIPKCKTLENLKDELTKQGIETLYKYKGQTSELQGISFKLGEYKYKGSEVDRKFSIKNIERALQLQQSKAQIQRSHSSLSNNQSPLETNNEVNKTGRESLLDQLIRPEQVHEQLPYQWKIDKQQKKKRGRHL